MKAMAVIVIFFQLFLVSCSEAKETSSEKVGFLIKPTGRYNVGFTDMYFAKKHATQSASLNEVMIRIYYPSKENTSPQGYYEPFINEEINQIKETTDNINVDDVKQFRKLKSFSSINLTPENKTFPLIYFIPGYAMPCQAYENIITNLVSNGYIVVGINSPGINLTQNSKGETVGINDVGEISFNTFYEIAKEQYKDFKFIHEKVVTKNIPMLKNIDISNIAAIGHSLGTITITYALAESKDIFKTSLFLDPGTDTKGISRNIKEASILYIISSAYTDNHPKENGQKVKFNLNTKSSLVQIASSDASDINYCRHMNFSDFSTLQYLDLYKKYSAWLKEKKHDITVLINPKQKPKDFPKTTVYVFEASNEQW